MHAVPGMHALCGAPPKVGVNECTVSQGMIDGIHGGGFGGGLSRVVAKTGMRFRMDGVAFPNNRDSASEIERPAPYITTYMLSDGMQ